MTPLLTETRMVTLADVQAALGRIRESIYLSPCARSETFSQAAPFETEGSPRKINPCLRS